MPTATATFPKPHEQYSVTIPDAILMARIAAGDPEAFEEIYRRHQRRILLQARKLCATKELAEEVTQETFIALWRGARLYSPRRGSVSAWLSGMVRNRSIDAWRRAASRPSEVQAFDEGPGELRSTLRADETSPERAALLSLVGELPPAQREAVFLSFFGDLTHAEIAARTQVPLGTIKSRIRCGLQRLREGYDDGSPVPAAPRPLLRLVPERRGEPGRLLHDDGLLARTA
jgi:RNA polymerase sigma-70 factor (ECF subfamily)